MYYLVIVVGRRQLLLELVVGHPGMTWSLGLKFHRR